MMGNGGCICHHVSKVLLMVIVAMLSVFFVDGKTSFVSAIVDNGFDKDGVFGHNQRTIRPRQ
jgi:hypothetical protein